MRVMVTDAMDPSPPATESRSPQSASRQSASSQSASLLAGLNPAQRQAAEALQGPVCILAGAGTGKTRTITHRIAHQVLADVASPSEVLAVTFTDKAAGELRQRLRLLGVPGTIRAATFHAAAWAQLRHFLPQLGNGRLPEVLPSKVPVIRRVAGRIQADVRDLASEVEWAKARMLSPSDYERQARPDAPLPAAQMAALYRAYEEHKDDQGLIDYEDMLLRCRQLLLDNDDVAAAVRQRYRYFTVDEYQDVNPAQHALLRAWLGERRELCVVGDDDQTIYSFTGASSSYLVDFPRHFPGAAVITLTQNYRSTPQVLSLANRVLRAKTSGPRKRLQPTLPEGPAPVFSEYPTGEAETEGVAKAVRRLLDAGVAPGEVAICYRTNSQSESYEQALGTADIPYTVRGGVGFFQRQEISQALRVLAVERDRWRAEGPPEDPARLPGTAAASRAGRDLERVLREGLAWHPRREPEGDAARERWRNLSALADLGARLAAEQPLVDLPELVDLLLARAREGGDAPGTGAVTLLTLHRAKGLEFDAVFLVACEEGLLPISFAKTEAEVEEERRLFYVGVTRARRHLSISWAAQRLGWGGRTTKRQPSRLLVGLAPGAPSAPSVAGGRGRAGARTARGAKAPAALDLADPLVAALREWRSERARRDAVPPYIVCNDATLADLADRRPANPKDLLRVNGIGPAKADRYGSELLDILRTAGG